MEVHLADLVQDKLQGMTHHIYCRTCCFTPVLISEQVLRKQRHDGPHGPNLRIYLKQLTSANAAKHRLMSLCDVSLTAFGNDVTSLYKVVIDR